MTPNQQEVASKSLEKAIEVAGSQAALAVHVGVTQQAVQQWVRKGLAPITRCPIIESVTGISKSDLRPDIWEAA